MSQASARPEAINMLLYGRTHALLRSHKGQGEIIMKHGETPTRQKREYMSRQGSGRNALSEIRASRRDVHLATRRISELSRTIRANCEESRIFLVRTDFTRENEKERGSKRMIKFYRAPVSYTLEQLMENIQ